METVKERLKFLLKELDISETQFTKKIGVSRGYVSTLKSNITANTLEKIAETFPSINIDWLSTGEGDYILKPKEKIKDRFFRYLEHKKITEDLFTLYERNYNPNFFNFINDIVAPKEKPFISRWKKWKADFLPQTIKYVMNILKYNKYDDLNLTWLVTGEGEMLLSSPPNEQIEKLEKKNIELIKQIAVLEYQLEQANRQKKTKK